MKKYLAHFSGGMPTITIIISKDAYDFPNYGSYESYHDTFDEARTWLLEKIEDEMAYLERQIDELEEQIDWLAEKHEKLLMKTQDC